MRTNFFYSQFFVTPPYPKQSFDGKTVIVTGSNVGLGLEAARHIARLGAAKLILGVRNADKGAAAKADIEATTSCAPGTVEVWPLDLASYASVKAFAARVDAELPRLDAVVENAGIETSTFTLTEGSESTITTNVLATFLLAMLLLPKLKATAAAASSTDPPPVLAIVSSEVHYWTTLPELRTAGPNTGDLLAELSNPAAAQMAERYPVSKLLEVFFMRALAARAGPDYPVVLNFLNPGFCHSELARNAGWGMWALKLLLARTTEIGSRTLVHAAGAGKDTHGEYLSNCRVEDTAPFVLSDDGAKAQERVWEEISAALEGIQKGVMGNL